MPMHNILAQDLPPVLPDYSFPPPTQRKKTTRKSGRRTTTPKEASARLHAMDEKANNEQVLRSPVLQTSSSFSRSSSSSSSSSTSLESLPVSVHILLAGGMHMNNLGEIEPSNTSANKEGSGSASGNPTGDIGMMIGEACEAIKIAQQTTKHMLAYELLLAKELLAKEAAAVMIEKVEIAQQNMIEMIKNTYEANKIARQTTNLRLAFEVLANELPAKEAAAVCDRATIKSKPPRSMLNDPNYNPNYNSPKKKRKRQRLSSTTIEYTGKYEPNKKYKSETTVHGSITTSQTRIVPKEAVLVYDNCLASLTTSETCNFLDFFFGEYLESPPGTQERTRSK